MAASEISKELELKKTELTRVSYVASRATVRELGSLKEEGTVPYVQHKDEVCSASPNQALLRAAFARWCAGLEDHWLQTADLELLLLKQTLR